MSKRFDWGVAIWYYNQDGLGSISEITDWQGNLQEKYTYDEYGSFTIKDAQGNPLTYSPSGNRFYFTGREYDFLTGLYYYRARYYDPSIGRFLQKDPIGYYGGINLYTYVGNNPVNWRDPWGLVGLPGAVMGGIGGAIAGGISGAITGSSGGVQGAIGGAIGGAIAGGISGAIGGALGNILGGTRAAQMAGSVIGAAIGELIAPPTTANEGADVVPPETCAF